MIFLKYYKDNGVTTFFEDTNSVLNHVSVKCKKDFALSGSLGKILFDK